MNDETLREQIDLYVAGALDDAEQTALEHAVENDPQAAAWLAESRRTWAALDECATVAAPQDLVHEAWKQGRRPAAGRRRLGRRLAIAAALVLAAIGTWRLGRSQPASVLSPQDHEVVQQLDFLLEMEMLENIDLVRKADVIRDLEQSGLAEYLEDLAS